jgi:mRNA (guanine-N7-)-methyltransferase
MVKPLENMRKFHNKVKGDMLLFTTKGKSDIRILELAAGSGGDLHKWNKNSKIKAVDGYDIVIDEAHKRLEKMKTTKSYTFTLKDLSAEVVTCETPYDIISCQFAFHYFFKSKKTMDTVFSSIKNCSSKGTVFYCTLFDGAKVLSLLGDNGKYETPEWYIKKTGKKAVHLGNSVEVYIKGSILDKPTVEYLVKPEFLIESLKRIGFSLVLKKNFSEFYNEKHQLSESEKTLSFLNNVYVFLKN